MAPTTQEPDDDAEHDTHCCGKCCLVFTSLDAYIQHKLSKDNCKVTYTKGNRWLIPRIVVKKEKRAVPVGARKGDNAWGSEESSKASARKKGMVIFYINMIAKFQVDLPGIGSLFL